MARLTELPYRPDSTALFAPFSGRPWAMLLDSAQPGCATGRWDILVADPSATLVTRGAMTEIRDAHGCRRSAEDPFALLRAALGEREGPAPAGLPFAGGAVGWFGYDLARRIERLPVRAIDAEDLPEMAIGVFDWALLVDHQERRSWLVGADRDTRTPARWPRLVEQCSTASSGLAAARPVAVAGERLAAPGPLPATTDPARHGSAGRAAHPPPQAIESCHTGDPLRALAPLRSNLSEAAYTNAFGRVQAYIRAGDCYQVNLAQRFAAPAKGDPWAAYRRLRMLNPAPFSAYLKTPFGEVLSSSPERFLALRHGQVETRPIKGTRPRGATPGEDAALRQALTQSEKDRAENLMIVDLLRNDLGRVCRPGSIRVPALFDIETYASVHHLVSTVRGELRNDEDAASLLRACFPGGSITGAPKIRAMEIIEELEPHRRGVYCGAIGYLGFDGAMDTNIAIRTIVHNGGQVRFWAGGGLVVDSDPEQEYRETYDKASRLMQLLAPESSG
ncbi:MAG: aminodeoxychorismate synthase component I [Halochromatium sp.]|uniref:aminodeoxychorismate synthase component I n=1 Tax=Halochromatium sp. TaxID=2049430 RepID=UPI00397A1B31